MSEDYLIYDEGVDHLTIYKAHEKIVFNIDTGFVVLSLNEKREIVGMEFMGMHKNFKVPFETLKHITGCTVEIRYEPQNKMVVINMALQHQKVERPIVVSSHTDLGNAAFSEQFACSAVA